jgi:hypothetical protein
VSIWLLFCTANGQVWTWGDAIYANRDPQPNSASLMGIPAQVKTGSSVKEQCASVRAGPYATFYISSTSVFVSASSARCFFWLMSNSPCCSCAPTETGQVFTWGGPRSSSLDPEVYQLNNPFFPFSGYTTLGGIQAPELVQFRAEKVIRYITTTSGWHEWDNGSDNGPVVSPYTFFVGRACFFSVFSSLLSSNAITSLSLCL